MSNSLIQRLSEATAGSRELDVRILAHLEGWTESDIEYAVSEPRSIDVRPYTASLDSALTLVPEGFYISHFGEELKFNGWYVRIKNKDDYGIEADGIPEWTAMRPTLALALCSAALRARGLE